MIFFLERPLKKCPSLVKRKFENINYTRSADVDYLGNRNPRRKFVVIVVKRNGSIRGFNSGFVQDEPVVKLSRVRLFRTLQVSHEDFNIFPFM